MNNKYVYQRENLKILVLISLIIVVPLSILSIFLFLQEGGKEIGFTFLFTLIIFLIIIFIFSINRLKWRKWHRNIKKLGIRVPGKVINFGYRHKSGNLHYDPPTMGYEEYWLTVMYVDSSGSKKIFDTPVLSFSPDERNDITCNVYIYNNDILVTDFNNLKKKKIDWSESLYYIIFGIIIVGICLIVSWFKN